MVLMSESGWLFLLRWIHFLAGITWIGPTRRCGAAPSRSSCPA